MKVLLIGPSIKYSKGGMATVIDSIINDKNLNSNNEIIYITSHVDGEFYKKIYYFILAVYKMILLNKHYKVIHLHSASDVSFLRKSIFIRIGNILGKKSILHLHSGSFENYFKESGFFLKKFMLKTFEKSSKVIVLSEHWKEFLETVVKYNDAQILKNGINLEDFKDCINKTKIFNNFLYIGRIEKNKGIYDLIEALNILINKHNKNNLKLYIAGDGEINLAKDLVRKYNIEENIIFLGWVKGKDKKDSFRLIDTVILPSYYEGLPMAILEGMASEKVIISTRVGGIPDVVIHGVNGFLFNPGDIEALCKYILEVNENKNEMINICSNNIKKIDMEFNLATIFDKLSQIYDEVGK